MSEETVTEVKKTRKPRTETGPRKQRPVLVVAAGNADGSVTVFACTKNELTAARTLGSALRGGTPSAEIYSLDLTE